MKLGLSEMGFGFVYIYNIYLILINNVHINIHIYIDRALSRSIYSSLHTKQDGCLKRVMERRWLLLRICCLCGSIKVNLKTSVVLNCSLGMASFLINRSAWLETARVAGALGAAQQGES